MAAMDSQLIWLIAIIIIILLVVWVIGFRNILMLIGLAVVIFIIVAFLMSRDK